MPSGGLERHGVGQGDKTGGGRVSQRRSHAGSGATCQSWGSVLGTGATGRAVTGVGVLLDESFPAAVGQRWEPVRGRRTGG